jgi:UDP-GlcNAc3NAcA epimerase
MKIITVIGARPQFVKAGAVSRAFRKVAEIQELIIHTGQHYDENMSKVFFDELEIPRPAFNLGIGSGPHGEQTGRMLAAIEEVFQSEKPDFVLVYGDTNSTLAGALAAAKLHIPVAHVEAGLRSFNRRMPEEINRILTDHLSAMLFAPTTTAVRHLSNEGIAANSIHKVGDVMYDAALFYGARARTRSAILKDHGLSERGYFLATVHRAENTDDRSRLRVIVEALSEASEELPIVLPVHPRTRKTLADSGIQFGSRVHLIDPVGYVDMLSLEMNARAIATDSGGVQKEAYFYGVPCITLRDETEWTELVDLGWNRVVPPLKAQQIVRELLAAAPPAPMNHSSSPYGTGNTADQIRDLLLRGAPNFPNREISAAASER